MPNRLIDALRERLAANRRVKRKLSPWGMVAVDRQVPFILLIREPATDGAGLSGLIRAESSFLIASDRPEDAAVVRDVVTAVVETVAPLFGAFLLVELWPTPGWAERNAATINAVVPRFEVIAHAADELAEVLPVFAEDLAQVHVAGNVASVSVVQRDIPTHPNLAEPIASDVATRHRVAVVGLEVAPIHVGLGGAKFPQIELELRRELAAVLRKTVQRFSCSRTTQCPVDYRVLGPRAVVRSVWRVDEQLAQVADSFDFLLQVTPVNLREAWLEFERHDRQQTPVFHYRPLPVDPIVLKRQMYKVPVEQVEDPALSLLFRDKLDELDRMVTLLHDMNTPRFAYGSAQVFGGVEPELEATARSLLRRTNPGTGGEAPMFDATQMAEAARAEIAHYQRQDARVDARVEVRADIASALMVSHNVLIVGADCQIAASRVPALLAHEIGTHLVTYFNGKAQPLRQLYCGLAGYEELQEGTAVLAEYLVGGLTLGRLRVLAARVVAVRAMFDGASFVDVFRSLVAEGFAPNTAFTITARVFRGGGLSKDAVYLRGLIKVLDYLAEGGSLSELFVGKVALPYLPVIRELQWRGVLAPSALRPSWIDRDDVRARAAKLAKGATIETLADAATATDED